MPPPRRATASTTYPFSRSPRSRTDRRAASSSATRTLIEPVNRRVTWGQARGGTPFAFACHGSVRLTPYPDGAMKAMSNGHSTQRIICATRSRYARDDHQLPTQ